jgi:hypothetical protein
MRAPARNEIAEHFAHLDRKLLELRQRKALQVRRLANCR